MIPLKLRDPRGAFQADNLEVDGGKAIRLALGGAGIRSLEYDKASGAFWVITGAALNDETEEFRVLEWRDDSGSPVFTELVRYSSKLKPEGITRATAGDATTRFLVFDTGRYHERAVVRGPAASAGAAVGPSRAASARKRRHGCPILASGSIFSGPDCDGAL